MSKVTQLVTAKTAPTRLLPHWHEENHFRSLESNSRTEIWHQNMTSSFVPHRYFINQCACILNCFSHVWLFATLWTIARPPPPGLLCQWDSPGETTGVVCHALLQGIFLTRDRTDISCIAGGFFTYWATWEVHQSALSFNKNSFLMNSSLILRVGKT